MEELLKEILKKLDKMDHEAESFRGEVIKKLNTITEQVVKNTEFEVTVHELTATVQDQGTDIKLIKKLLSNQ